MRTGKKLQRLNENNIGIQRTSRMTEGQRNVESRSTGDSDSKKCVQRARSADGIPQSPAEPGRKKHLIEVLAEKVGGDSLDDSDEAKELLRIKQAIKKQTPGDYEDEPGHLSATAETLVQTVLEDYAQVKERAESLRKCLEHEQDNRSKAEADAKHKGELFERLRSAQDRAISEVVQGHEEKIKSQKERHGRRLERLREAHQDTLTEVKQSCKQSLDQQAQEHEENMKDQGMKHNRKLEGCRQAHQNKLNEVNQSWNQKLDEKARDFEEKMRSQESEYSRQLESHQKTHQSTLSELEQFWKRRHDDDTREHERKIEEQRTKHKRRIEGHMKEHQAKVSELEQSCGQRHDAQARENKDKIEDLKAKYDRQIEEHMKEHQANMSALEQWKNKNAAQAREHESKIKDQRSEYMRQIDEHMKEHQANMSALEQFWKNKNAAQAREHEDKIEDQRSSYSLQIEELVKESQTKLRDLEQQLDHQRQEYNNQLAELMRQEKRVARQHEEALKAKEAEYHNGIAELAANAKENERELRQRYKNETKRIMQIAEELKQDLSHRENIKGLTDRELVSQFMRLSTDIEDFSRVAWDARRSATWPFTNAELAALQVQNIQKLKRQVLQNCLWLTLDEFVFRSPFRIMGKHGHAFDSQKYEYAFQERDGKDEAESADLNMKRYENAKVFLAALNAKKPLSTHDSTILNSYQEARKEILARICDALEKVVAIDQADRETLDGMLQFAAKLWLEVCSQRYRLFIIVPDKSQDVLSLGRDCPTPWNLVVRPRLQRFGTATGAAIHEKEAVTGWKSQTKSYPS